MDDDAIRAKVAKTKKLTDLLKAIQVHPAAEQFPMLEGDDFVQFVIDIRDNGQSDKAVFRGKELLDGRNRYAACEILGRRCLSERLKAKEIPNPFRWVMSKNMQRRHLTVQQRAMVAASMLEAEKKWMDSIAPTVAVQPTKQPFKAGAKKEAPGAREKRRQRAREREQPPEPQPEPEGRRRDAAAEAVNVSPRSVAKAASIQVAGSKDLVEAVNTNKISLDLARALSTTFPNKGDQNKLLKQGSVGIRAAIQREQAKRMTSPDDPLRAQKLARSKAQKTLEAGMRAVDDYAALVPNKQAQTAIIRNLKSSIAALWKVN